MQTILSVWGSAIWFSLSEEMTMFLAAMPKIIGFAVILIVGWFIASLIEKGVDALLGTVKSNNLTTRTGFGGFVSKIGVKTNSVGFIALVLLVATINAVEVPVFLEFLQQIFLWLPNWVVALVVLVIGRLAARAMSRLVRGETFRAELGNPNLLATITNVVVWAFAIVIAINHVGIATTLGGAFMAMVGTVALALGLTFGLSGRETAAQILHGWYEKGKQSIPQMQETAQDAQEQSPQQTRQPMQPPR